MIVGRRGRPGRQARRGRPLRGRLGWPPGSRLGATRSLTAVGSRARPRPPRPAGSPHADRRRRPHRPPSTRPAPGALARARVPAHRVSWTRSRLPRPRPTGVDLPILGAELGPGARAWAERDVAQVIVAFSTRPRRTLLLSIVRRCHHAGVHVAVVPRLFEVHSGSPRHPASGRLAADLARPRRRHDSRQLQVKYTLDRVFACAAPGGAPRRCCSRSSAAIRLTMGGPVLYRQERVGRNGGTFPMLKFRTMSGDGRRDGEGRRGLGRGDPVRRPHQGTRRRRSGPRVTGVGALAAALLAGRAAPAVERPWWARCR